MPQIFEDEAPGQTVHLPGIPAREYKQPPGVTVRLDPGDEDNGLDIEVTVRSAVEAPWQMLNRARRGLTEAIRGAADEESN